MQEMVPRAPGTREPLCPCPQACRGFCAAPSPTFLGIELPLGVLVNFTGHSPRARGLTEPPVTVQSHGVKRSPAVTTGDFRDVYKGLGLSLTSQGSPWGPQKPLAAQRFRVSPLVGQLCTLYHRGSEAAVTVRDLTACPPGTGDPSPGTGIRWHRFYFTRGLGSLWNEKAGTAVRPHDSRVNE